MKLLVYSLGMAGLVVTIVAYSESRSIEPIRSIDGRVIERFTNPTEASIDLEFPSGHTIRIPINPVTLHDVIAPEFESLMKDREFPTVAREVIQTLTCRPKSTSASNNGQPQS